MTVKITCTEQQALIIEIALDVLSRMTMGQLSEMIRGMEFLRGKCFKHKNLMGYGLGKHIEELIKPILFPELQPNESYGVGMKELGKAQIAYEMVKCLQNHRSKDYSNPGVLGNKPLHYSKKPLIKIEDNNDA